MFKVRTFDVDLINPHVHGLQLNCWGLFACLKLSFYGILFQKAYLIKCMLET